MASTDVNIREFLYDPVGNTDQQLEWIEIQNTGTEVIDLTDWTINDDLNNSGNDDASIPAGTLQPGQIAILYNSDITEQEFRDEYDPPAGALLIPVDNWQQLGNGNQQNDGDAGDNIVIRDTNDVIADSVEYPDLAEPGESLTVNGDGTFTAGEPTPECFLTGTLILTEQGEKPVEDLKIGDLVQTTNGTPERIKWIGRQTIDQDQVHPFRTYPIQIKAGALGNDLPQRDLYVSPDHALLVDGVLANAGALTNGMSIIQIKPEELVFNYYHIELEHHALMLAEGVPAESFIPQNMEGRDKFDNSKEFDELYPEGGALAYVPMSYPRVSSQRQLPGSIATRLQQVAEALPNANVLATA